MRDAVMDKVLNRLVFLTGWSSEATELAVLTKVCSLGSRESGTICAATVRPKASA